MILPIKPWRNVQNLRLVSDISTPRVKAIVSLDQLQAGLAKHLYKPLPFGA
jgi:hypothetical protein